MPRGLSFPPLLHLPPGDRIEHDFNDLVREFDGSDPVAPLAATALLTAIVARALRLASAQQTVALMRNRERIERVVQYIDINLHRAPSAKELATVAGISTSRLHTVFRSLMDYSPHDYMLRRRMREARRLLGERNMPIKEIASRLGFDNVNHFSAVFRRIEGVPPARYREESRSTGDERIL
jgi:AraC family transcriptional regulator